MHFLSLRICLVILSVLTPVVFPTVVQGVEKIEIGFFEGGDQPVHQEIRLEIQRQLEHLAREDFEFGYSAEGYRSAEWNRETSRKMAKELASNDQIDVVIAIGPWAAEDLLEAGFKRPIVAVYRFDPVSEGLVNEIGRPIAENLAVQYDRRKIERDLRLAISVSRAKRVGVLLFPSGQPDTVMKQLRILSTMGNFELVTAEGFNNVGTYAFFKAYAALDKNIDVLYLPPMWDMNKEKLKEFFTGVARDKILTVSYDGRLLAERGAVLSTGGFTMAAIGTDAAKKILRILRGETPNVIPMDIYLSDGMTVNNTSASLGGFDLPFGVLNEAYRVGAVESESAPVTLAECVGRALDQNPSYLARREALKGAAAASREASAAFWPQVDLAGRVHYLDNNLVSNSLGFFDNTGAGASLILTQKLISFQALRASGTFSHEEQAQRFQKALAALDLEYAVTSAFLNQARIRELIDLTQRHRNLIDSYSELARSRMMADEGTQADAYRLENERHRLTQEIISLDQRSKAISILLSSLIYMPVDEPLDLLVETFSSKRMQQAIGRLFPHFITLADEELLMQKLTQESMSASPIIGWYDSRVAVQRSAMSENRALNLPSLDLKAAVNYSDYLKDDPRWEEKHATWSIAGELSFPIFEGKARSHRSSRLEAGLSEIEYQREAAILDLVADVRTATTKMISHAANFFPTNRSKTQTMRSFSRVATGFEKMEMPVIDVLDTREASYLGEAGEINNRYDFYLSLAELMRQVGWSHRGNDLVSQFQERIGADDSGQ